MERWTLLIYRIPPQPTRARLSVWRKLQALGAVYLQDGVSALPSRADLDENMRVVAEDIASFGGSAMVFRAEPTGTDEDLQAIFRAAADKRYAPIESELESCRAKMEGQVSLADVESIEQDVTRNRIAYLRAKRISYFGGDLEESIEALLRELRRTLDALGE